MPVRAFLALGLVLFLRGPCLADDAAPAPAPAPLSFTRDVAPILVRNCLGCHDDGKAEGGLSMATFASLRKGGKGVAELILEPGDPDASELVVSVRADASPRMPYKLPPLSDRDVKTLERWIEQGAKFDGPSATETAIASLVDPLAGLPKVAFKGVVSAPATSAVFSPDGQRLALAVGREVRIFDPATGRRLQTLDDHPGPITTVRFTPSGDTLVAAGGRPGMFGAFTLWDQKSGVKIGEFRSHRDTIQGADVSPDGSTLATVGYDRAVILWDLPRVAPRLSLLDHTDAVFAVAFSPDGRRLATAGADRTVKVWDVARGAKIRSLGDATSELYAVAFSADGATVLAGGVDRSIRAWTLHGDDLALDRSVFAHDGAVLRLVVSREGKTLVSSGEDRGVRLWELPGLRPLSALGIQSDWPQAIALSPDGELLAVGRHDGSLDLFDSASGKRVSEVVKAEAKPATAPEPPALVRDAALNPPTPRGAARGSKVRVTLGGRGVGAATEVLLPEPGLTATIVPKAKPNPDSLEIDLEVASDARVGLHRFSLVTPLGVPAFQSFLVTAHPL
ncbi:MAG: c-type cytochrome domain-containing protein, partial [Isosphaeraceae bacterium]